MKRYLAVFLLVSATSVAVAAQGIPMPASGDFGIGASVSSSDSTATLFFDLTSRLVLEPKVGFSSYNYADKQGSTSTNYPGTWWDVGLGLFYVVVPLEGLSVQVGPAVEYASEDYQNEGKTDAYQFTFWKVAADLRLLAMITRSLGVYTSVGGYYYSRDVNDTTTSFDSLQTGFGVESLSLGVAYYFK